MNKTRSRTSIVLTLLLLPVLIEAQKILDPVINPSHFKIHYIGPEDGISSPYIISAFQDQFGYIWTGTEYGVDLYNGYEFEVKRIQDTDSTSYKLNWIYNLSDDEDGGVWICSGYGLYYYDRYNDAIKTQYSHLDYPPIDRRCVVYGIWKDSQGLYWVFTEGGLFHFDRKKGLLTPTDVPRSQNWRASRNIYDLLETSDGSVWIPADPHGLYRYYQHTGKFIQYRHDSANLNSLSSDKVTDIIEDNEGKLWITTLGGGLNILTSLDATEFKHIRYHPDTAQGIFSDSLQTLLMDRSGVIWIAGQNGFTIFDPITVNFKSYRIRNKQFDFILDQPEISIIQLTEDPDGHMWLRPYGAKGILYFHPDREELYQFIEVKDHEHGIKGQNWIMSSFVDSGGLIWAVAQGGINVIEKKPQKPFYQFKHDMNDPTSLSYSRAWAILLDSKGDLWVGNEGPVLNRSSDLKIGDRVNFTHYQMENQLYYQDLITAIVESGKENLWIGTWNGLFNFNLPTQTFSPEGNSSSLRQMLGNLQIDDLYLSANGWLWIADKNKGLYIYDPLSGRLASYPQKPLGSDGPSPGIFSIFEDTDGNFWFGHLGFGISRLSASDAAKVFLSDTLEFIKYSHNFGGDLDLSSDMVMDVHQDKSGRMWFSTSGGLNLFIPDQNSFQSFYESDGLTSDCVNGILEDGHGNLWISSLDGINKLELNQGYGPDVIRSIHTYGRHHGLEDPVFNEKCCFKSDDGWMFFGGIYGVTYFHPDSVKDNNILTPVHITKILVNDSDLSAMERSAPSGALIGTFPIKLPYHQNFLSIEYVALNYLVPEGNQYRYRLVGLDEVWVGAGARRFAEYRDLKPGKYTFRVIASNEDGLWNEEGAAVDIIIHPPWYASMLAYFIYVILLAGSIYLFIRWRTRRLQNEKINLESMVQERTFTIEQQKEELQITLENLQETQTQLIQSEKLAALGGLVAGVAHELNTPVGISVTAASSLAEETREMADKYKSNKISRAEFKDYLNTSNQSARLILSNMEKAATMVQSFKQVSVDQSTEQKRKFKLKEYTEDVIRSLYPKLKDKSINIFIEMDDELELNSFPGTYSQILTNLVLNSLVHGFDGKEEGTISINAHEDHNKIAVEFLDDGVGISKDIISKIFDPFFTTNKKAGTGLGLHIVHNLVDQKLKGSINCDSEVDRGTRYLIEIPVSS